MAEQEVWIAECHLVEIGGGSEYSCKAAVWADDVGSVRSLLDAKFQVLGYKVLWLDGCLPVRQYLSNHGGQTKIAPLAHAVHPGHLVELSRLVAVSGGEPEPENYLIIEEIEGVEPLDAQLGVHPRKNVPDALMEPLFGQPEPTEAEIAHYGSAEAVPPLKTYAILDAGKFQFGRSEIERCDLPFKCLFKGDAAEELKDVAPYLIELSAEADFTRRLLTHNPNMPDTMTTVHLWHKEPGIYIRSRASFETLWKHFRKFTRIQDENGKWFLWRYWEPTVFMNYARLFKEHREGKVPLLFGPENLGKYFPIIAGIYGVSERKLLHCVAKKPAETTSSAVDMSILRYLAIEGHARIFAKDYAFPNIPNAEEEDAAIRTAVKYYKHGFKSRYHLGSFVYWRLMRGEDFETASETIQKTIHGNANSNERFVIAAREMKRLFGNQIRNYRGRRS